jgi:energy-converting hydrogenase Eha subunit E
MIRQIAVIITLTFSVGAVLTVAGPVLEAIAPMVENDPAVQEVGHDSAIQGIVDAVLIWAPLTLLLGFICVGFVWVLRRERVVGRR